MEFSGATVSERTVALVRKLSAVQAVHTFLVGLQFVVYDLPQVYTPGGSNEPCANTNQSLT
jgi:hypothetical protein